MNYWLNENLKITLEIFSLSKFDFYLFGNTCIKKAKEKGCLLSADYYYYFCKHKQKEQTKLHSTPHVLPRPLLKLHFLGTKYENTSLVLLYFLPNFRLHY